MVPDPLIRLCPKPARLLMDAQAAASVEDFLLCREVIEAVIAGGEAVDLEELSVAERAQAALAEQFAFSVGDVTDEMVAEVRKHMTDAQTWAFVVALYEIDMETRLRLVVDDVL